MRLSALLIVGLTFVAAAGVSLVTANYSVTLIEERSEIGVRNVLDDRGLEWAEVAADGLQVTLAGIAPTEALRFQAITAAGSIVDAARVIDDMEVEAQAAIAPPRFSVEILRNDAGMSVFGLIPAAQDRDDLSARFATLSGNDDFTNLLETADYPTPEEWDTSLSFALNALDDLPRAKVSVEAGRVRVVAMADSAEAKAALERRLQRAAPPGLNVSLDISAPRPVLTPFTLRFVQDDDGIRFDACSADTERARDRIIQAAFAAGLTGPGDCTIGMGVPTPRWADAAERAIAAVSELGGGSVTFSDADVALLAPEGTSQQLFDKVVGELENELPRVFALKAVRPQVEDPTQGPAEFTATLSPEGLVQLRGRVGSEETRDSATAVAQAAFGSDSVYTATRVVDGLPSGWSKRVLTGLAALSNLSNGAVVLTADTLSISGNTGDTSANSRIAQLLADELGEAGQYDIRVTYQKKLDPVAGLPTPEECEAEIGKIASARKIVFAPGETAIDAAAIATIDEIVEVLKNCGGLKIEIQGHTDDDGREAMNLRVSQERAQAVLDELRRRSGLKTQFTAKGYGESTPIADNQTKEGREANRRIEFRLILPEPATAEPESTLDALADQTSEANQDTEQTGEQESQSE